MTDLEGIVWINYRYHRTKRNWICNPLLHGENTANYGLQRRHKMLLNKTQSQQLREFCLNSYLKQMYYVILSQLKTFISPFKKTQFWGFHQDQIIIFPPISMARMQIIKTWPVFGAIYNSLNKSIAQVNTCPAGSNRSFIYCFNYQTMTSPWLCQARYWFGLVQSLSRRTKVVDSPTFPTSKLRPDSLFIWNIMGELPSILLTSSILHLAVRLYRD